MSTWFSVMFSVLNLKIPTVPTPQDLTPSTVLLPPSSPQSNLFDPPFVFFLSPLLRSLSRQGKRCCIRTSMRSVSFNDRPIDKERFDACAPSVATRGSLT